MASLSVMVKPASSACNLRCRYCFYADVAASREVAGHGIMRRETAELLAQRLAEAVGPAGDVHVSFQGGEPTLAGLDWFRTFVSAMDASPGITPHWSLQTNGTLLNREWASFLAEHDFLVGVSLDGPRSLTDFMRPFADCGGSFDRTMNGILQLKGAHVEFNVLSVITRQGGRFPEELMEFYLQHRLDNVQLIPCLPPLDSTDDGFSLRPDDFRRFYLGFFHAWREAAETGRLVRVNLFDNLLGMLLGHPPYQCGMLGLCAVQYVIESNGDVYPCDFYCLDRYRLGNLADAPLRELGTSAAGQAFLGESACRRNPCATCPYARICNGGCRRQNVCYLTEESCAYRDVLAEVIPALIRMYGLG